jgi:hypothetical protein
MDVRASFGNQKTEDSMAGIFEATARHAIAEIVRTHTQESKYGYVIPKEAFEGLCEEIFRFFKASRDLKDRGDRLLMSGGAPQAARGEPRPRPK